MSRVRRKPVFCICETKGGLAPLLSLHRQYNPLRDFNFLAIFCGCAVQFVSDLVENSKHRFSRNVAQYEKLTLLYDGRT